MAVAFLALTLLDSKINDLPRWLATVMSSTGPDVGALLSRLLYDLSIHDKRFQETLEQLSLQMLDVSKGAFETFRGAAYREQSALTASFAVKVIQKLLNETASTDDRATFLHNLGTSLYRVKRYNEAIEAYEQCLVYRRKLAFWPWATLDQKRALALSLDNYANCLSDIGQKYRATEISNKALKLRRKIRKTEPAKQQRGLAVTLSNLASHFIEIGQHDQAVKTATESVEICEELQKEGEFEILSDLARALHNLSKAQARLDQGDEALQNIGRAVEIRRRLYSEEPDKYGPDLGRALNNQSSMFLGTRRPGKAFVTAQDRLAIV